MDHRTTSWATLRGAVFALLAVTWLAGAAVAGAQVYRWTDSHGVVHYSDKPHTRNAQPVQLPALQHYDPAVHGNPLTEAAEPQKKAAADTPPPRITQPADGATLRDAQNRVSVSVSAVLAAGQGFVYYVDGKARNTTPTRDSSMVLAPVWRGTHHISVAIVDADGQLVSRSAPVTIYMKQPTVHHPPS